MAYTLDDFHLKAIQDYGLDAVWPQEVLTEAKLIPNEVEEIRFSRSAFCHDRW